MEAAGTISTSVPELGTVNTTVAIQKYVSEMRNMLFGQFKLEGVDYMLVSQVSKKLRRG